MLDPNPVKLIFLMLGTQCNLNCEYCMQHSMIEHFVDKQNINQDIYKFIDEIGENNKDGIEIRFYGGEPLVYFNDMKEVVKVLNESLKDKVAYSIITNGKLINEEIVEFFNKNKFRVAVSWDGRNVNRTRKYDVIKQKRDLLLKIDRLDINSVISAVNYPEDFLNDINDFSTEYNKIHTNRLLLSNEHIMDNEGCLKNLTDIDYMELATQMKNICNIGMEAINKKDIDISNRDMLFETYFIGLVSKISNKQSVYNYCSECQNGYTVLNLDLQGNLYECHNNWKINGSIYEYLSEYQYRVAVSDPTLNTFKSMCHDCPVVNICGCGCPVQDNKIKKKTYCKLMKAMYMPVIKYVNKILNNKDLFEKIGEKS